MSTSSTANIKIEQNNKISTLDKIAKKLVLASLSKLQLGHLIIEDRSAKDSNGIDVQPEIYHFGESPENAACSAHICVEEYSAYRSVFFNSSIGAGEAYMQKSWTTPDLLAVIRLMVMNLEQINKMDNSRPIWKRIGTKFIHLLNSNTKKGSKKNISAHYDLGNDFFSLFLDPTMMYSAAMYPHQNASLSEASTFKLDQICQKLQLSADDHLLEIGTGWGGMAIHAAKHYGCKVTTTTISQEQYDFAKQKVIEEGLEDRITLLLEDYRNLTGKYDKLVSIEMIEAVGHRFYDSYFRQCCSLLKQKGLMLIQAITIADQRYQQAKNSVDFIQRYIFPGGCLPSNAIISQKVANKTDMQIIAIEDITEHYADTLLDWRMAFMDKLQQVKNMGFDDTFCRMWEFYLCYCEGGFRERAISTAHFLMAKPEFRFLPVKHVN
ncbi:class I SAM-dependent methyltransferase [Marinomonas agarivorans]|nr:class I SAM-dependent methyltransferase [Marinomonas agarivorans]